VGMTVGGLDSPIVSCMKADERRLEYLASPTELKLVNAPTMKRL
jgi:hypothetical protein